MQVNHIAGNFYEARDENGPVFIGTKKKAEAFAKKKHTPKITTLFEEAVEEVEDTAADETD